MGAAVDRAKGSEDYGEVRRQGRGRKKKEKINKYKKEERRWWGDG
jgi:hypothetical protein